jgi:hypothetical protein
LRDGTEKRIKEKHAMTSHPALRDSTRDVGEGNFRGVGKAEAWEEFRGVTDNGEAG